MPTKDVTSNAALSRDVTRNVTTTAAISAAVTRDVTTDAAIGLIYSLDVTSDAAITTTNALQVTTTAALSRTETSDITTSAAISIHIPVGIPSGEEAIYASRLFPSELRVMVDLDPPIWTQEQQDTFAEDKLDVGAWAQSWLTGGPRLRNDAAELVYYWTPVDPTASPIVWKSMPLFEWFRARETYPWLPDDPTKAFKIEMKFIFPEDDPVYSVPIIVPGLNNSLGDLNNPLLIQQQGSAVASSTGLVDHTNDGHIRVIANGSDVSNVANDKAEHTVTVEWDPSHITNAQTLTVRYDGSSVYTSNTAAWPRQPHFGWSHNIVRASHFTSDQSVVPVFTDQDGNTFATDDPFVRTVTGGTGDPTVVLRVTNFKVTQLGAQGYEVPTDPAWVVANHSATGFDDADEGEIVTVDNRRWARLPAKYLQSATGDWGRKVLISKATLNLTTQFTDEIFIQRWVNRIIIIDSRQVASAGTSSWKRRIAGVVRRFNPKRSETNISATVEINSLPEDKLNVVAERAWRGDDSVTLPGVNVGYTLDMVFQDILDTAEAIHGNKLGITNSVLWTLDLLVSDIGTLGQILINVLSELMLITTCGVLIVTVSYAPFYDGLVNFIVTVFNTVPH